MNMLSWRYRKAVRTALLTSVWQLAREGQDFRLRDNGKGSARVLKVSVSGFNAATSREFAPFERRKICASKSDEVDE